MGEYVGEHEGSGVRVSTIDEGVGMSRVRG